jgi:N-formylmaleamate deformylase
VSTFLYGANVAANGIRQHYLRYGGKGTPLVLLPGITSPAATWGFVCERLGESFDTYVFDARGRGLSSGGKDLDYGLDAMADDVAAALDALQLTGVLLVGHSMGARIAIRAARRPSLPIHRLVLVDPPVSGPGRRAYGMPLSFYIDSIRMAAAGCGIEQMRSYMPAWSDEHLRLRAEWLHTCEEAAIARSHRDLNEADVHSDLPHIDTPTLLIVAGGADVIRPEESAEMARLCPALTVRTVSNAGHMIPWDNFEGFFLALLPFLESDHGGAHV